MNKLADFSQRVVRKVEREGLQNTIAQLGLRVESILFDKRYGLDTHRNIPLSELEINSPTTRFGRQYQPILVRHLRKVLSEIKPNENDVLVDFGSGKGRVLLIAAMSGIKRAVGVEFSAELCDVARDNVNRLKQKADLCPVEIYCMDAGLYEIKPEETIFFFFNPFEPPVMQKVLDNIVKSFDQHPREMTIVYINLKSQEINGNSSRFHLIKDSELNGLSFQLYNVGTASASPSQNTDSL